MAYPISSSMENYLSWAILWWCALHPDSAMTGHLVKFQDLLNTHLPKPILNICHRLASGRTGLEKARAHGIGIHTQNEIIKLGKSDLRVLSDLLFDQPVIVGNEFTLLDVVAFALLAQLHFICKGVEHPLRDAMNQPFASFVILVTCVQERAFPDWEEVQTMPKGDKKKAEPKTELYKKNGKEKDKEK